MGQAGFTRTATAPDLCSVGWLPKGLHINSHLNTIDETDGLDLMILSQIVMILGQNKVLVMLGFGE